MKSESVYLPRIPKLYKKQKICDNLETSKVFINICFLYVFIGNVNGQKGETITKSAASATVQSATVPNLFPVGTTTIRTNSTNNYREDIEPRNALNNATTPTALTISSRLTTDIKATITPADGRTSSLPQLMPRDDAYKGANFTVEAVTKPGAITITKVESTTTRARKLPPSFNGEATSISNGITNQYGKEDKSRNAADDESLATLVTTIDNEPTVAMEAITTASFGNTTPYIPLIRGNEIYGNDDYIGSLSIESTTTGKPTTIFSAAIVAAAETYPEEAIPSVALSVTRAERSTYPDKDLSKNQAITMSSKTATTVASKLSSPSNTEAVTTNNEIDAERRSVQDGGQKIATSSTIVQLTSSTEGVIAVSDETISFPLTPKDNISKSTDYTGQASMETTASSKRKTAFSAATLAYTQTVSRNAISAGLPVSDKIPTTYTDKVAFTTEAVTTFETGTTTKTTITVFSKPPPLFDVSTTTIRNEAINDYRKVAELSRTPNYKTTPSSATTTKTVTAGEASTAVPETPVSSALLVAGAAPSHIETTLKGKPIIPSNAAVPAGADTFLRTMKPASYDIKPTVYPHMIPFKAEAITNSPLTTINEDNIKFEDATITASNLPASPKIKTTPIKEYRKEGLHRNGSAQSEAATAPLPATTGKPPILTTKIPSGKPTTRPKSLLKEKSDEAESLAFGDTEWVADKTLDWIYQYLTSITKRFPKTTRLVQIGKSKGNKPIYAVEISHKMSAGATVVIDAGYDASDRLGVNLVLYMIHELLEKLGENLLTLSGVKIIVVPLINPDNYKLTTESVPTEPCRESLFPSFEIGQEPIDPCPGFFREVETVALGKYYQSIRKFKLYFSIDSGAAAVGYPYGFNTKVHDKSQQMAENMGNVIKHKLNKNVTVKSLRGIMGQIDGTPIDWLRDKVGVRYCIYLCLEKTVDIPTRINVVKVFYESLRYGILELQLTDAEVAQAIYDDFDAGSLRLRINIGLIMYLVITNVWFQ
ncbi:hypothetical protein Trydic_g13883 [Trypoxylus dichotomus]